MGGIFLDHIHHLPTTLPRFAFFLLMQLVLSLFLLFVLLYKLTRSSLGGPYILKYSEFSGWNTFKIKQPLSIANSIVFTSLIYVGIFFGLALTGFRHVFLANVTLYLKLPYYTKKKKNKKKMLFPFFLLLTLTKFPPCLV